jgi:hypothetical protein
MEEKLEKQKKRIWPLALLFGAIIGAWNAFTVTPADLRGASSETILAAQIVIFPFVSAVYFLIAYCVFWVWRKVTG